MFANFNGYNLDEYLRITDKLQRPIGSERKNNLVTTGRGQRRFVNSKKQEGYIDMPFVIRNNLINKKRALADILNVDEPVKLWFEDEPDKYYWAIPDGLIDVDEIVFLGKGSIRFLIPDGVAHAMIPKTFPFTDGTANIENKGTGKTPVSINVTFTSDANSIGFVSEDNIVQLGTPISEDEDNAVQSTKVMNDDMGTSTKNLWSTNVGRVRWRYDDGDNTSKIQGALTWGATEVYPTNYGPEADKDKPGYWHGPTITRFLTNDLPDLNVYHRFEFKPNGTAKQKQTCQGLYEFNFIDADNNFVMGFEIKDNTNTADKVEYSFFIGNYRMFTGFLPQRVLKFHRGFFGSIQMKKEGNEFYFRLARINGDDWKETWSIQKSWFNETVAMLSVSALTGFMSKWKNDRPMTIKATHTRITEFASGAEPVITNIFYEGDNLFVEGETNRVYINGLRNDSFKVRGSDQLFNVPKGLTEIVAISDGTFNGYLEIEERFT